MPEGAGKVLVGRVQLVREPYGMPRDVVDHVHGTPGYALLLAQAVPVSDEDRVQVVPPVGCLVAPHDAAGTEVVEVEDAPRHLPPDGRCLYPVPSLRRRRWRALPATGSGGIQ